MINTINIHIGINIKILYSNLIIISIEAYNEENNPPIKFDL
jgi:hypothetical protein